MYFSKKPKNMRHEIDQSGKVEETSQNTVVAVSNSRNFAVIITAREKRKLQEHFRRNGIPSLFVYITFASLLIEVIKHTGAGVSTNILIDTEYPGHEKTIIKMVGRAINTDTICLSWGFVGKKSKAHDLAYKVFTGKVKANVNVKSEKIWKMAKRIAGENLNPRLKRENRNPARLK